MTNRQLPRMRDNLPALRRLAERITPGGLLVEIGAFAGESTKIFLDAGLRVHSIDPWNDATLPLLRAGARDFDPNHRWHFTMAQVERTFDELLPLYPDRLIKRKGYDMEFVENYADGALDAIYLDAVHTYDETLATIHRWRPKLKPGGLLCGHDYSDSFPGVTRAVQESFGRPLEVFADSSWCVSAKR